MKLYREKNEKNYTDISDLQDARATELFRSHPEAMRAHRAAMQVDQKPKELNPKTVELMALAIAITQRCEGCVVYNTKTAQKKGASRAEILDTIAVAIQMDGGPATIYSANALEVFDQFSE